VASIENAVITDLKGSTSVTTYTGNRIYYLERDKSNLDQGTVQDHIVITNPSVERRKFVQSEDETSQARLQFNCFSDKKDRCREIAEAVVNKYRTWRYGTISSVKVHNIEMGGGRALSGVKKYGFAQDLIFNYSL
jgi:hypothetical protein